MEPKRAEQLAQQLLSGQLNVAGFVSACAASGQTADVGEAMVDLDRHRRCGFAEVVYAEGKTSAAMIKIFHALLDADMPVLATRVSAEQAADLNSEFSEGQYNAVGRTYRIAAREENARVEQPSAQGRVAIVTAGTSDLPVAEEARETAAWMGADVRLIQDVGVAGPQRLRQRLPELVDCDVVVVVAGMEGALPSVVGGYLACPVIAVPTSVGYGANFGGLAALLGMLNSCAANVAVVNIDAGFKGGYLAGLIARRAADCRAGS